MTARTEWETRVDETVGLLVAGATTVALYGPAHPRSVETVQRLAPQLDGLLADEPDLAFVVLGEELFVQGRPFTRVSRHAAALIRRFRRREIEHATFLAGIGADEVRGFLEDLARTDDSPLRSRPHLQVGVVDLSDGALGGPDASAAGEQRKRLATVRDRVTLVQECLADFAQGRGLAVADLSRVVYALWHRITQAPSPLKVLAAWEGEERWPAVQAHNVAALAMALARFAGVGAATCRDLGVAGLVHNVGKALLPADLTAREIDQSGDQLEFLFDHPRVGLEALLRIGQLPPLALVVTFEHHLNHNGTGYPRLLHPRRPHPAARVTAVADAFVNLFTARVARGLLTRGRALAWLDEHAGSALDPAWVGALREMLIRGRTAQPPG